MDPQKPVATGPQRDAKGRLLPGQTLNRGGRPKGLAARVREAVGEGADIVEFFARVLRDERASTKDRIEAGKWLADRGWGRALETSVNVDATGTEAGALAAGMADATLEALARQLAPSKATGMATVTLLPAGNPAETHGNSGDTY